MKRGALPIEGDCLPAELASISAAERDLGFNFPGPYRRWLETVCNGARLGPNAFDPDEASAALGIGVVEFCGVGRKEKASDLVWLTRSYRDRLPPNVVPVAHAEGGNLICLDTSRGSELGSVYFWDHGEESADSLTAGLHRIAADWVSFLAGIRATESDELPPAGDNELIWVDPDLLHEQRKRGNTLL
jgi:hypothetical protein